MAFRATRKTSTTKPSPKPVPTEDVSNASTPASEISVEDLVGGPVKKQTTDPSGRLGTSNREQRTVEEKIEQGQTSVTPSTRPTPLTRPSYSSRPRSFGYRRPQRDFDSSGRSSGGFSRQSSGFSSRSYTEGNYGNGSPRSASSRRDGFGEAGNGHEPDINVVTETVRGILDTMPEGHGFLRPKYTPSERDIYISMSQIRRFLLRNGDMVEGQARLPKDNERYWGLLKVEKVNELPAEQMERRPKFEDLTPVYPNKLLKLETGQLPLSTRMIDLVVPIGFGQRGLVVSPPKAGKTTILKEIAAGVTANYPDVHLMAALIGERPEEVTDISRSVKGEVFASNFDESPAEQTRIAEVALDRAKRLVEMGRDVVILLDSITRLARAYNLVVNPSGRTLSGGFDPAALYPAKRFLGAARCVEAVQLSVTDQSVSQSSGKLKTDKQDAENRKQRTDDQVTEGGSLTVIGTALIDTGSRMDDLIYEEFKGTGNMELTLSRILQERRIFPAIDVGKSGTRHDELLLGEEAMKKVTTLRHMLSLLSDEERTMMLIERLSKTKSNAEFLESLAKG